MRQHSEELPLIQIQRLLSNMMAECSLIRQPDSRKYLYFPSIFHILTLRKLSVFILYPPHLCVFLLSVMELFENSG